MPEDNSLYLLLGQLNGKVDAIMASISAHKETTDYHSKRISSVESEIAALKAGRSQNRSWITTVISVAALGLSAIGVYLKG